MSKTRFGGKQLLQAINWHARELIDNPGQVVKILHFEFYAQPARDKRGYNVYGIDLTNTYPFQQFNPQFRLLPKGDGWVAVRYFDYVNGVDV